MKYISLFDIVGPVMVGPSSSHTAGAVRLGLLARKIYGQQPESIKFVLYNSFAKTGKRHGTDRGLLGGVLGFNVSDMRIRDAFDIAKEDNIKYEFEFVDDPNRYPNSVDINFMAPVEMNISGDSVGAGEVRISNINGFTVDLKGDYPTILLVYKDQPGMISKVSAIIQGENVNVASLSCERAAKGKEATMSIGLDSEVTDQVLKKLELIPDIYIVRNIEKLEK